MIHVDDLKYNKLITKIIHMALDAKPKKSSPKKSSSKTVTKDNDIQADLPNASDEFIHPEMSELKSGKKIDFKITTAKAKVADLKNKIWELNYDLGKAKTLKNISHAKKIKNLMVGLQELEDVINSEIKKLEQEQEAVTTATPAQTKLMHMITTNCSEYIEQVKKAKKYLYRGSSGPDEFIAKSWDSRRPKDSDNQAQKLFDQMLAQQGFVALRGNSIFATSDMDHASQFGDSVYFIFPADHLSHFTYTNQSDLTLDDVYEVAVDPVKLKDVVKRLTTYLKTYMETLTDEKSKKDIQRALSEFSWGPGAAMEYIARQRKTGNKVNLPEDLINLDLNSISTVRVFNKNWAPKNTALASALKKEKEVYVSGVYYALEVQKWHEIVRQAIGVKPSTLF